jgi:hypothetical protein
LVLFFWAFPVHSNASPSNNNNQALVPKILSSAKASPIGVPSLRTPFLSFSTSLFSLKLEVSGGLMASQHSWLR